MTPPTTTGIDFETIALWLGGLLMSIMSFFGTRLWNDVRNMKENWITREEYNKGIADSKLERDNKHLENTGNFRRMDAKLDRLEQTQHESAVTIEKRLGEVLVHIEKMRPPHRTDGPDRRRY